ncbi:MAG: class I SAM-dependent methyltransferase [Candidatus Binatia bacterium]
MARLGTQDRLGESKKVFLEILLREIVGKQTISTVLDVGCGFGFFSRYLNEFGLSVMAIDGRAENVAEAKRLNPGVEVKVGNVEDASIGFLGMFDLVLCFGLLYHLENPFRAIRNLASLTEKVLMVETVIAPTRSLTAYLYEEDWGQDQGLNYIALIPTERWFVKCFYRSGFSFVYKTRVLPGHEDFRSSLVKKRRRTFLVASKVELPLPLLYLAPEPKTNRYMWDSLSIGGILHYEPVRRVLRSSVVWFRGRR